MRVPTLTGIAGRFTKIFRSDPHHFLGNVRGVVHVGANAGQERNLYAQYGLNVLWVEPIPDVFAELTKNIAKFPKQKAVNRLVTDKDGVDYPFHIANNSGQSSSILDLKDHAGIWPDVKFEKTITLKSVSLRRLMKEEGIDASLYDALVMDTQGSELLILQGAGGSLDRFQYVKSEAPDFESYAGCCRVSDLSDFLSTRGFRERRRDPFAKRDAGGTYFDVIYQRSDR